MRVVFIGASMFGARCLDAMFSLNGITVVGAVTAPRIFSISYNRAGVTNVLHADIHARCAATGIPVAEITENGMHDAMLCATVRRWNPQAFIVAGWYHMIPARWREIAPAYGLHASLLPDYSGGAPLVWAMIQGETETGITLFRMDGGVDSGPIVGQAATPITADDTIATLYARIEGLGVQLLTDYLPRLANGTAALRTQDASRRRLFPQRSPADGVINWTQPAARIHDFIRAQTKPYPGAFTHLGDRKLTIWAAQPIILKKQLPPASLALHGNIPVIHCAHRTALALKSVAIDSVDMPLDVFVTAYRDQLMTNDLLV